jgi:hypothetical protein
MASPTQFVARIMIFMLLYTRCLEEPYEPQRKADPSLRSG